MATQFTPLLSLFGGCLIGLAAVLLMAVYGKIAGMSGMLAGVIPPLSGDWQWRAAFLAGSIMAPALFIMLGGKVEFAVPMSSAGLVIGGIIVGLGVYFGSGCTSGHGICGNARLSQRSIVATLTFMATCAITVFIVRHVLEIA